MRASRSTHTSRTRRSSWAQPIETILAAVPFSFPTVSVARIPLFPRIAATVAGAMQIAPIGFPALLTSRTRRATSGCGLARSPAAAKSERFFAAPYPPGRIRPSISSPLTVARSRMFPRAILAASTRQLRLSPATGAPVRWFATSRCATSGAMHSASAPARSRERSVRTASWISEPSRTPQPERRTPMRAMEEPPALGRDGSIVPRGRLSEEASSRLSDPLDRPRRQPPHAPARSLDPDPLPLRREDRQLLAGPEAEVLLPIRPGLAPRGRLGEDDGGPPGRADEDLVAEESEAREEDDPRPDGEDPGGPRRTKGPQDEGA